ncbi:MAG TPA: RtcB family protein [Candidatus Eisenbacteria bacterium]|nr:RtcB family protein [Candidatus Eisenbacteria bacterium]
MVSEPIPAPAADGPAPMSGALRVGRNFVYRIASQVASALINVGAMVMLGRALTADGYGRYAFYYALVPLIAALSDSGVGIIMTREVARHPEHTRRWIGDAILVKAAIGGFMLAAVLLLAPRVLDPEHSFLLVLVTVAGILDFGQDVSIWTLRAMERLDFEACLLLVSQGVWVAVIGWALFEHKDVTALIGAAVLAFSVRCAVAAWIVMGHFYRPQFQLDVRRLWRLALEGLPFGLAVFGVVLYGRVGLLLLRWLSTPSDVSLFQVGFNLSQPFDFIATALCIAVFPSLARYAGARHPALEKSLHRLVKLQFVMALPVTVALCVSADLLIRLFFHGHGFEKAAVALRVLSLGLPVIFLHHVSRYVLAALGRQRLYLRGVVAGLVVNAGLCAWWIPHYGFLGACFAFLVAEVTIWGLCQWALRSYVSFTDVAAEAWRPIAAAAVTVAFLAATTAAPLAARGLGAAAIYVVFLRVFRALRPEEFRLFRSIVHSFMGPMTPRVPAMAMAHAGAADVLAPSWSGAGGTRAIALAPSTKITVHTTGRPSPDPRLVSKLDEIAQLPCVRSVVALPDLHQKANAEAPSSIAIETENVIVPSFTSISVNDGMGVLLTDLDAEEWDGDRVVDFFARVNRHAAAHPLDRNRYSLSGADLQKAALEGAPGLAQRYGLDAAVGRAMERGGRVDVPNGNGRGPWSGHVPALLRATAAGRCEMGLNFGGNHFLELQKVEDVLDRERAAQWGLEPGRLVVMYHLGPGPFASALLHHFEQRLCVGTARAPFYFASKLWHHYGPGAAPGSPSRKWQSYFRGGHWTGIPADSDEGGAFQAALAMATNFGFAYRMATIAAVRDALTETMGAPTDVRLLCDVAHNSLGEETWNGDTAWVSRHNACRVWPGAPTIVSGSWDVPSYLACGASDPPEGARSHDHGAGKVIDAQRRGHSLPVARGLTHRVDMRRGRRGRLLSHETIPVRSAEPIDRLIQCLERAGALCGVARLRPVGTLKN